MAAILALDIGGTFIKSALVTEGKLGDVKKTPTPQHLEAFEKSLRQIKAELSEPINGVGISMPGLIDPQSGFAVHGGALSFIRQLNLKDFYHQIFDLPVEVDNDARCAITGEMQVGKLRDVKNALMLVLGTGIGGSIIVNGSVMMGAHHSAGELSYIQTAAQSNPADFFVFKNSVSMLLKAYAQASGGQQISGEAFFDLVKQEDETAVQVLTQFCDRLAVQLWNLQTILDPEKIVIGGGISGQALLLTYINKGLQNNTQKLNVGPLAKLIAPQVELSALGNDANLLGAYYHFLSQQS